MNKNTSEIYHQIVIFRSMIYINITRYAICLPYHVWIYYFLRSLRFQPKTEYITSPDSNVYFLSTPKIQTYYNFGLFTIGSSVSKKIFKWFFCFSSSCVHYVASFSRLFIFDCPFVISYKPWHLVRVQGSDNYNRKFVLWFQLHIAGDI